MVFLTGKKAAVNVFVNEVQKDIFAHNDKDKSFRDLGFTTTYQLRAKDTVRIYNRYNNSIRTTDWADIQFIGFKLN